MIDVVLAPNPGLLTLDGTNTYVITSAGKSIVVDPGPSDTGHRTRIEAVTAEPKLILATHRHDDHYQAAPGLAARWQCRVRSADRALCIGADPVQDTEVITVGDVSVRVVSTPGHTDDSISLLVAEAAEPTVLLTGDTVLGCGTTMISCPDGDLGAYLSSLARLAAVVGSDRVSVIHPGHGPVITDPAGWIRYYQDHRAERLDQVRAALDAGGRTAEEIVDAVYPGLDARVRSAALQSLHAQLAYLQRGAVDS